MQELANAVTMLPNSVYVLTAAPPGTPLRWTIAVVVHTCAAVIFHIVLWAGQKWPARIPTRVIRATMDLDMFFIHVGSLATLSIHASESATASVATLALNAAAVARIYASRRLPYGKALEAELVGQRYPLIFALTMIEALLVWLYVDAAYGAAICALFCLTCVLVLADVPLGGWGHPIAHLALLPGCIARTEAVALRSAL